MTYTIAIANEKGGVAKTTSALSLGAALAGLGLNVLLIDLDPQANLTLSLGFNPRSLTEGIADIFMSDTPLLRVIQETPVANLHLAPANHSLLHASRFISVREDYAQMLRHALTPLQQYDYILLDCPPTVGPLTENALSAARLLVIPTQCEYYSAHALREMLSLIRVVRQQNNASLRYRLLLTMYDRRNRIHRGLNEQIRAAFQNAVFDTVIETDTRLRESPVFGLPITEYAPDSRSSIQYQQLAEELRHYAEETV